MNKLLEYYYWWVGIELPEAARGAYDINSAFGFGITHIALIVTMIYFGMKLIRYLMKKVTARESNK